MISSYCSYSSKAVHLAASTAASVAVAVTDSTVITEIHMQEKQNAIRAPFMAFIVIQ